MENSRYNLRDRKPQDEEESSEELQDSLFPLRRDLRLDFPQESDEGSPDDKSRKKNNVLAQNRDTNQSWSFWGWLKNLPTVIASKIYSAIEFCYYSLDYLRWRRENTEF